jgi:hypothetical protein
MGRCGEELEVDAEIDRIGAVGRADAAEIFLVGELGSISQ